MRDNQNNRWKRKIHTHTHTHTQDRKKQGATEAIVGGWELNDFVGHLSWVLSNWYIKLL